MRITLDVLRRFTPLPDDVAATRRLLDEVGLEVKRIDPSAPGVPVTLELLANRGDHHAYVGLAREVTGRTGGPLTVPGSVPLTVGDGPHPIRVETPLCPVYSLTALERTGGFPPFVILDFSAVPLTDLSGVAALRTFAGTARREGTTILVAGAAPSVRNMLLAGGLGLDESQFAPDVMTARAVAEARHRAAGSA